MQCAAGRAQSCGAMWTLSPRAVCHRQVPVLMSLFSFRCLHFLLSPHRAPLATVDSLPQPFLTCQPPVGPPCLPLSTVFSPAGCLAKPPTSATTALPASPALPLQTVKLPHPAGAPLAVPGVGPSCQNGGTCHRHPLLAVAPQGVWPPCPFTPPCPAPRRSPVLQRPSAWCPATAPPPLHAAQTVQAAAPQPRHRPCCAAPPADVLPALEQAVLAASAEPGNPAACQACPQAGSLSHGSPRSLSFFHDLSPVERGNDSSGELSMVCRPPSRNICALSLPSMC